MEIFYISLHRRLEIKTLVKEPESLSFYYVSNIYIAFVEVFQSVRQDC